MQDREQQRREFAEWSEQHADELSDLRLDRLRAQLEENRRVQKDARGADLIFKTTENALLSPPADELNDDYDDDELGDLAEEMGSALGQVERELRLEIALLHAELRALRAELAASKVVPLKGHHRDVA
jgi:hypothetical protein